MGGEDRQSAGQEATGLWRPAVRGGEHRAKGGSAEEAGPTAPRGRHLGARSGPEVFSATLHTLPDAPTKGQAQGPGVRGTPLALTLAGVPPAHSNHEQTSTLPSAFLRRGGEHTHPVPTNGLKGEVPALEATGLMEERQQDAC